MIPLMNAPTGGPDFETQYKWNSFEKIFLKKEFENSGAPLGLPMIPLKTSSMIKSSANFNNFVCICANLIKRTTVYARESWVRCPTRYI